MPVTALKYIIMNVLYINSVFSNCERTHYSLITFTVCAFFLSFYYRVNFKTDFEPMIRMYKKLEIMNNLVLYTYGP